MLPARADRNVLLNALRERRLDRTLTSTLPAPDPRDDQAIGPTGLPALDARLGGGLPRGHVSEIVGSRSSGRTSLLLQIAAAATARGELVGFVDALDMLDVASASAAGIELSRLLWIRGHVVANPGFCRDLNLRAMEQAVKALGLILQAGNFGLVVLDVGDAPPDAVRRLPFTTWLRLQRMVEGRQTICVLAGNEAMSRSSAGLSIALQPRVSPDRVQAAGPAHTPARFAGSLFDGLDLDARVSRARIQAADTHGVPVSTRVRRHV